MKVRLIQNRFLPSWWGVSRHIITFIATLQYLGVPGHCARVPCDEYGCKVRCPGAATLKGRHRQAQDARDAAPAITTQ